MCYMCICVCTREVGLVVAKLACLEVLVLVSGGCVLSFPCGSGLYVFSGREWAAL